LRAERIVGFQQPRQRTVERVAQYAERDQQERRVRRSGQRIDAWCAKEQQHRGEAAHAVGESQRVGKLAQQRMEIHDNDFRTNTFKRTITTAPEAR
jgi:hypothetical protein